jgi:cellulose synthase/poly-beta-1,6-N-acetylglucosamine synthase-like glycosyltransferase
MLPVSVVISARNAAIELSENLPHVLQQDYDKYEVIVIDDHSTDDTPGILKKMQKLYPHLIVLDINAKPGIKQGKKEALMHGISCARHPLILLTDADCKPASNLWISMMIQHFRGGDIVLGVAPFYRVNTLLNASERFEGLMTSILYLSFALNKMPYMGVGRNLAYKKALFDQQNGFAGHLDLLSGDDDLFVNATSTATNTSICMDTRSFMRSDSKASLGAFITQKRRHLGTGRRYRFRDKLMLGAFNASLVFQYVGLILFLVGLSESIIFYIFAAGLICRWFISIKISSKLEERDLGIKFPLLEPIYMIYLVLMAPVLFQKPVEKWN